MEKSFKRSVFGKEGPRFNFSGNLAEMSCFHSYGNEIKEEISNSNNLRIFPQIAAKFRQYPSPNMDFWAKIRQYLGEIMLAPGYFGKIFGGRRNKRKPRIHNTWRNFFMRRNAAVSSLRIFMLIASALYLLMEIQH